MNKVGIRHLAPLGALALALGLNAGTASACSTDAWTTVTAGAAEPIAGGPLEGTVGSATRSVRRYMGLCGLQSAAGGNSFVAVDHGQEEATYRARFYFYASSTAPATVMQSFSDAGATTSVISVTYDPAGTISATVPGSTGLSVGSVVPNRWYGVEVTRIVGSPAVLAVRGGGGGPTTTTVNQTVNGTGNATGGGVRVTRLGAVGATTGTITVDEFEASRGASAIGFRCRGDATGNGVYDLDDIFGVIDEFLFSQGDGSKSPALGSADYDENGAVELDDIFGTIDAFLADQASSPGAGCP